MEGKITEIIWHVFFSFPETFGEIKAVCARVQSDVCARALHNVNNYPGVLIFPIPCSWDGYRPSEVDCFFFSSPPLFCRKHSSLMTGEVTRRSIQTVKREKTPILNLVILLKGGSTKERCDLQHNICGQKASWDSCSPLGWMKRAGWGSGNKRRYKMIKWSKAFWIWRGAFCCGRGVREELWFILLRWKASVAPLPPQLHHPALNSSEVRLFQTTTLG